MNAPLKDLDPNARNLIIDVCKSGRHRAVAAEESQLDPVKTILHDEEKGSVFGFDLQAETHWHHLCASTCKKCKPNNRRIKLRCAKRTRFLSEVIPSSTPPSAPAAAKPSLPPGGGPGVEPDWQCDNCQGWCDYEEVTCTECGFEQYSADVDARKPVLSRKEIAKKAEELSKKAKKGERKAPGSRASSSTRRRFSVSSSIRRRSHRQGQ